MTDTPVLPQEMVLHNAAWFIDDQVDGGKVLKLVPLAVTPDGLQPWGTPVVIAFNPEGWAKFQRDVATGRRSPVVVAGPTMAVPRNGKH